MSDRVKPISVSDGIWVTIVHLTRLCLRLNWVPLPLYSYPDVGPVDPKGAPLFDSAQTEPCRHPSLITPRTVLSIGSHPRADVTVDGDRGVDYCAPIHNNVLNSLYYIYFVHHS